MTFWNILNKELLWLYQVVHHDVMTCHIIIIALQEILQLDTKSAQTSQLTSHLLNIRDHMSWETEAVSGDQLSLMTTLSTG